MKIYNLFKSAMMLSVAAAMSASIVSCQKGNGGDNGGDGSRKVTIEDLHNRVWNTQIAQFYKDSTWMVEADAEGQIKHDISTGEPIFVPAYEYATQLAMDYNTANPGNPVTPEDAMYLDFTADYDGNRQFHEYSFKEDEYFVLINGNITSNGYMICVLEISGQYVFDEAKQEFTVDDKHSNIADYHRQLLVSTKMVKNELHLRFLEHPNPSNADIPEGDLLLFRLNNYDGSKSYYPHGKIVYICKEIEESVKPDLEYHPSTGGDK